MFSLKDDALPGGRTDFEHFHNQEDDDHHHDDEEANMSNVLIAKGVTMLILCTVSTCMGILPMQLAKYFKWTDVGNPRSTRMVNMLLGFGGGVLFCTTFLHMLPEIKESVQHLVEDGKIQSLPFSLAETLTCAGFFIMYLVEESVHTHLKKKQASSGACSKKNDVSRSTNGLVENGETIGDYGARHTHFNGHGHSHQIPMIIDERDDAVVSSLRGLLIVLGLSVHELFEGLAIGLESSATYVWYMFAAVAAHKFVIAFCIGVELISANTKKYLSVIYVCVFAVVSPIGIAIGMLLVGGGSAAGSGVLAVVLQGLASGTLLYVVFFEILQEHRSGIGQYLSILFGFVLMFGLQILTAHSHSHSHSHSHDGGHRHSHSEHHDEDHVHESDQHHRHDHSNETNGLQVLTGTIDRVTESIVDAFSNALSSPAPNATVIAQRNQSGTTISPMDRS